MKKTIFFIATLFFLVNAKAQEAHFGIKAGLNASSLNYNDNSDMQTKIGFNVGFLAHIHTSNKFWAIQPEVYYSNEGAKSKNNNDIRTNLGFINIPVLIQYMFDNGFRLEAGPQVNFLVNAKERNVNFGSNNSVISTDVKKRFNSADFSIPLGLGYVSTSGVGFDARYNFGISNIYKTDAVPITHSNVFQFDIFYQFSGSKK